MEEKLVLTEEDKAIQPDPSTCALEPTEVTLDEDDRGTRPPSVE